MFEKILFPCDLSEACYKCRSFIKQLKGAGVKEVVVFHVIDQRLFDRIQHHSEVAIDVAVIEKEMEKQAQEEISRLKDELEKSDFKVETRIKKGIPFIEILKAEQEEGISALVIGSHGLSSIKEAFLGSVAEKVVRKSNKPVLVVRR